MLHARVQHVLFEQIILIELQSAAPTNGVRHDGDDVKEIRAHDGVPLVQSFKVNGLNAGQPDRSGRRHWINRCSDGADWQAWLMMLSFDSGIEPGLPLKKSRSYGSKKTPLRTAFAPPVTLTVKVTFPETFQTKYSPTWKLPAGRI